MSGPFPRMRLQTHPSKSRVEMGYRAPDCAGRPARGGVKRFEGLACPHKSSTEPLRILGSVAKGRFSIYSDIASDGDRRNCFGLKKDPQMDQKPPVTGGLWLALAGENCVS